MATLLRDRPHLTSVPTIGPPVRKDQVEDLHVPPFGAQSISLLTCVICRNIFGLTVHVPKFEDEIGVFTGNLEIKGQRLGPHAEPTALFLTYVPFCLLRLQHWFQPGTWVSFFLPTRVEM